MKHRTEREALAGILRVAEANAMDATPPAERRLALLAIASVARQIVGDMVDPPGEGGPATVQPELAVAPGRGRPPGMTAAVP